MHLLEVIETDDFIVKREKLDAAFVLGEPKSRWWLREKKRIKKKINLASLAKLDW